MVRRKARVDGRGRFADARAHRHHLNFLPQFAIEGLYAVGTMAGSLCEGADYPMGVLGLSIGRAITNGHCVGKHLAS